MEDKNSGKQQPFEWDPSEESEMTKLEKAVERYRDALHAIQTGVKFLMELGETSETSPKHLRTGINSALIDSGALADLLISKGVITEEEYYEKLAEIAERDVKSYKEKLEAKLGKSVELH